MDFVRTTWLAAALISGVFSVATAANVDPRAEVAAASTPLPPPKLRAQRIADERLSTQRKNIEQLITELKASQKKAAATAVDLRNQLAEAQENYVADLAARDRAYSQEIAVFRSAVEDIAKTAEGAAALARFNAGDEVGALAILDDLRKARRRCPPKARRYRKRRRSPSHSHTRL